MADVAVSKPSDQAALAFCTSCGMRVHAGPCTGAGSSRRRSATSDRLRWQQPAAVLTALALLVGIAVAATMANAAGDRARRAETANRRLVTRVGELEKRVHASEASAGAVSVRVGSLEAKAASQTDPAAVAKQVEPSVFTIEAGDSLGSGFVMRSGTGTSSLVTNFHVVGDVWANGRRQVKVHQDDRTFDGTIVKADAADDLAVIDVAASFPALARATGDPAVGDAVLVVGSPLGLGGTVSSGIVSALRDEDGQSYVQFSAPISPGNSGGPVVDHTGRVIGVSVMKAVADGAEGLSFAIPVATVCTGLGVC